MAFIDTSSKSASTAFSKGNPVYIMLLTLVATLGGLLFGYDTAVVNGAEKSLVAFYISKITNPDFYQYAVLMISQYKIMMTIVLYIVFLIISGQIIRLLGFKKGGLISAIIIGILSIWAISFLGKPIPTEASALQDVADTIKGFVIASALIGCVIGGASAGFISKSLGRKNGLVIAAIAFFLSAIGAWKPEAFNIFGTLDVYSFVVFRIIGGIGVGIASMISPMYIAEIAPANSRGKLVSFNQFAIIFGMLVIYFVNYSIAEKGRETRAVNTISISRNEKNNLLVNCYIDSLKSLKVDQDLVLISSKKYSYKLINIKKEKENNVLTLEPSNINQPILNPAIKEAKITWINETWLNTVGWRWMFFSGAFPAGLFLLLLFFVPETPRYLVMKGKDDKALKVLKKIAGNEGAPSILKEIKDTMNEKSVPWLSFGFFVIFIGIMLSVFQQFVGINVVLYYAGNIFRNMGASTDSSLLQTIIVGIVNLVFTVLAIFTVDRFGRKPLMIIGSLGMAVSMIALGLAFYTKNVGIVALIFMLTYTAAFAMSWGPVCWVLLAEIFPNSIRGAMSIAVAAQWIANWVVSLTFPMMNDNVWLTKIFHNGFSYWIYGIMGLLSALFMWKLVPETKGKTLEEMEKLWKK